VFQHRLLYDTKRFSFFLCQIRARLGTARQDSADDILAKWLANRRIQTQSRATSVHLTLRANVSAAKSVPIGHKTHTDPDDRFPTRTYKDRYYGANDPWRQTAAGVGRDAKASCTVR